MTIVFEIVASGVSVVASVCVVSVLFGLPPQAVKSTGTTKAVNMISLFII
ncbi:hypothetical protein ADIARSV_3223 [Arcticibacter svalbardensis MN12-7]|uniref:Uncharacterized protein n=1 Tax=Arcticibacter svalbardensis MN12-7 TaxID=1150600 RepID=R9GXG8_9SPHI|nr:hypothetical protein ADIARSV_3223 [Arcticibacter svalbardensis MN12-7]